MAGLVPAIHVFCAQDNVDTRDIAREDARSPGHDDLRYDL